MSKNISKRKNISPLKIINTFYTILLKNKHLTSFKGLILLLCYCQTGHSQVSNYIFSETLSSYSAISGTTAIAPPWNNISALNIPLGFTFNYNGTNYTSCSILSNGFITFGTTTTDDALGYKPISIGSVGFEGAISALGMNIRNNGLAITYTKTGTAPHRTFIVQWAKVRRDSEADGNYNFQIRLSETSNLIQIVYGSCSFGSTTTTRAEVGLRGHSNSDYNNRSQSSGSAWYHNTLRGTSNTDTTITTHNSSYPNNGLTYTWSPPNSTHSSCYPSSTFSTFYISNYKITGAIVETSNTSGYTPGGYNDYTYLAPAQQIAGSDINISLIIKSKSGAHMLQYIKTWVDWNKNGNFNDSGEEVFSSSASVSSTTFGFVIPPGTAPGNYRIRIRTESMNTFTPCGLQERGETEDYIIKVIPDCSAKIISAPKVERCDRGSVTLTVTGSPEATGYKWYTSETGGSPISGATGASYTTPLLNATTTYYVTATNGTCESLNRTPITALIKPIPNIAITPTTLEICGEKDYLKISAAGSTEVVELLKESFEGSGLGSFTKSGNGDATTNWQQRTNVFTTTTSTWKPAINSGSIGDKFAFTTADISGSDRNLILTTSSSFNTTNFIDLTLSFRHYFSYYGNGDSANIEVSTNNGASWTTVKTYTSNIGYPSKFTNETISLNSYVNVTNLKVRFRYIANYSDGWAVDDIQLYGTKPLTSSFTWSGATINAFIDADATIPYTNQAVNVVYIKPSDSQLEVNSWSFNVDVVLTNGCTAGKYLTVINKTKVWQGNNGNWNDPNNWLPVGVPGNDNCVIIKPAVNYPTINGSDYEAQAKTLTVKPSARLDIPSGNGIKVINKINVQSNGIFNAGNNASIVQVDNSTNSGTVNIERITKPMYRYDFTYWNSPVTAASGYTLAMLSPNTLPDKYMRWLPTIASGSGNWTSVNASTIMNPGTGYVVRAPQSFDLSPTVKTPYTATFVGTPNNGDIAIPITIGTDANIGGSITADDDQWNLIGNPYPSAVDIVAFLDDPANSTLVDGTVYLWTHNSVPSDSTHDPFYGTYIYNYTAADYATVNKFGATATAASGGATPNRHIASGQSFFVKGLANGNATFTNHMRVSLQNNNFMKTGRPKALSASGDDSEKHRIWLNLANESGAFSQILVGYASDATPAFDRGLDGQAFGGNGVVFYSTIPEKRLTIQALPIPFNDDDTIPLGYNANVENTYQIGIDHHDAFFNTRAVYLEDKKLRVLHDLKTAPYSFASDAGTFNDRFVLRFKSNMLGTDTFQPDNGIKILRGNELKVHSTIEKIKNLVVFDPTGRKIDEYSGVYTNEITLKNVKKSSGVVVLTITFENDTTLNLKTVF